MDVFVNFVQVKRGAPVHQGRPGARQSGAAAARAAMQRCTNTAARAVMQQCSRSNAALRAATVTQQQEQQGRCQRQQEEQQGRPRPTSSLACNCLLYLFARCVPVFCAHCVSVFARTVCQFFARTVCWFFARLVCRFFPVHCVPVTGTISSSPHLRSSTCESGFDSMTRCSGKLACRGAKQGAFEGQGGAV